MPPAKRQLRSLNAKTSRSAAWLRSLPRPATTRPRRRRAGPTARRRTRRRSSFPLPSPRRGATYHRSRTPNHRRSPPPRTIHHTRNPRCADRRSARRHKSDAPANTRSRDTWRSGRSFHTPRGRPRRHRRAECCGNPNTRSSRHTGYEHIVGAPLDSPGDQNNRNSGTRNRPWA